MSTLASDFFMPSPDSTGLRMSIALGTPAAFHAPAKGNRPGSVAAVVTEAPTPPQLAEHYKQDQGVGNPQKSAATMTLILVILLPLSRRLLHETQFPEASPTAGFSGKK